ncbi:hypothetical protein MMC06_002045 [Schaereria dolodes]|nr:hypothetical protein [Schaereria dolodes]
MSMPHHRDLLPGPGAYKEEPAPVAGDQQVVHQPHHPQQGPPPHLQHPRPSSIVHQQHHPNSPHQASHSQHPGSYNSPHPSNPGLPLQHQSPYAQAGPAPNGQPTPDVAYYANHPSPYSTPASGQYSSSEAPEMMAAAHMQRPYPPIYHTPQSNSPASVASPQSHDQHGRNMYAQQPAPQLQQGMYTYPSYPPMNQVHPSSYAQHSSQPQHQAIPPQQPLLISHQPNQQQMQHQQPPVPPQGMVNSPRPKLEPSALQRPLDPGALQRPPPGPITANHSAPGPPGPSNGIHQNQPGGGVNPNAAPGPIPATTPLVVRQDNNGVQWIAFEYSRDRVKMEYTIRCDVESVNVESLTSEFKTENCVYPRACCGKDQYRGNRLIYETECNTVGWALAELNPCLRGKRGLIQRAVDSWRNSNQDPKLRSRRVRRQAKINNRKQVTGHPPNHMAGPGGPGGAPGIPGTNSMAAPVQRQQPTTMNMGSQQLHHHHAHPDGAPTNGTDDVSGAPATDVRQSQVFHGYPNYPNQPGIAAAMPPSLHDGLDHLGAHGTSNPTAVMAAAPKTEDEERNTALYGDLPESKRRKFILVDDPARGARVRVRVTLDQVEMKEMPDSYRKTNSVYPRSYFPMQMQSPPSTLRTNRFFDDEDVKGGDVDDGQATRGETLVPVPMLEGAEGEVAVPRISRAKKRREVTLNDLGYRMSWSQSRVFAGRTMFLQKSLDAYRNKMRSTIQATTPAPEASTIAPHFETRVGKRRWLERGQKTKRAATP